MTIKLLKQMMDACYQAKRIRDMLPPLPKGVTSSHIQYLDVIETLQARVYRLRSLISVINWGCLDRA